MNYNSGVRKPVKASSFLIVIAFLLIFAVIFLAAGRFTNSIVKEMEGEISVDTSKYDKTVTATVIENEKGSASFADDNGGYEADTFSPIYQYEYEGNTYTARGNVSSTDAHYAVGDKTEVMISSDDPSKMYDPNYNAESEYKAFKALTNGFWIVPTILGVGLIVLTIFLVIRRIVAPNSMYTT
jgi:hypothetical protein